jgi:hypothetical protein
LLFASACTAHVIVPATVPEKSADPYVEALVQKADALRLYEEKQWLRLGHYKAGAFEGSPVSENDSPVFFLAPDGARDPRAELQATLRGFFTPAVEEPPPGKHGVPRHPLCKFPARFLWLSEVLAIDPQKLPRQQCAPFFAFLKEIDPAAVTVVFSSYYLNNPASAFGHTFLRFTKARSLAVGEKRELLDYVVDFAATVDTGNALIYAFKGLFGAFPGTVKRMPYYFKVREYADFESRDMWEYELEFTPKQLFMLVAHIWELGPSYFSYLYLTENCSYRIDMMLEAANPDIELMKNLSVPVLPADTIKVLFDNVGLVRKVSYRPSIRTQFTRAAADLDGDQASAVGDLSRDPHAPLPDAWSDARKVAVLDAALDLHEMNNLKEIVFQRDSQASRDKQTLLERRAAIRVPSNRPPYEPPWDRRPEIGHDSKRLGLSFGGREDDGTAGFVGLDFRLAMHDLADPALGYPEIAQIEFLALRAKVFHTDNRLRLVLDDLSIMQVVSLNSVNRFDYGMSWRFTAGARTLENAGCEACLAGKVRIGGGAARALFDDALIAFVLADLAVYAGDGLRGIEDTFFRAGIGPVGGLRLRLDPNFIVLGTGELVWFPEQHDRFTYQVDAIMRWGFAAQHALSLEGRAAQGRLEAQLFLLAYL